ncbi:Sec-independent protein translocase TatC (mitochondrion) [Cyanidioschyzon merolae]|jgi:Sec-independent protein secretion pathway component TatC|uniref:ORF267 n=2 Tax=Cyanidioschyzon merolae TaxID=45157 RepID=Q9ZZN6_CYAM1|nr:ORF267 [Cyanidioschyzon merolae]BAA36538.1 ORF267 [Cyanidioschyzon merolae strain 10D]BBU60059.1 Sec-independent protein translocase TatC [Cyanidioschyzon merolae]
MNIYTNIRPIKLYLIELKYRFYYFLFGLLICSCIILYKIKTIFFVILSSLPKKELIATEIYEIFSNYLIIITNFSLLFCYPLIIYHLFSFFCNAWIKKEKQVFLHWVKIIIYVLLNNLIFTYSFFIPILSSFFYNLEQQNNIFMIHYEMKINNFIYWFFNNLLSFVNVYIFPLSLLVFSEKYRTIKLAKNYRRYLLLLNLMLSFLLSFDIISQLIILLLLCINYEIMIIINIFEKIKTISIFNLSLSSKGQDSAFSQHKYEFDSRKG